MADRLDHPDLVRRDDALVVRYTAPADEFDQSRRLPLFGGYRELARQLDADIDPRQMPRLELLAERRGLLGNGPVGESG